MDTVQEGASGPDVKKVQQSINEYFQASMVPESGKFDDKTTKGVKQFQKQVKLRQTGVVDAATWKLLKNPPEAAATDNGRSAGDPSGKDWVNKFPTSKSLSDLKGPFASGMKKFYAALDRAGAHVDIKATFRPPERAYLMHYAYLIAHGMDPSKVPPMNGVRIDWVHKDNSGNPDLAGSKKAAQAMVNAYKIAYQPALKSRHTEGNAVDMEISWSGDLTITQVDGTSVAIKSGPRSGSNKELWEVGAGYGVHKLAKDEPHWSSDGH